MLTESEDSHDCNSFMPDILRSRVMHFITSRKQVLISRDIQHVITAKQTVVSFHFLFCKSETSSAMPACIDGFLTMTLI